MVAVPAPANPKTELALVNDLSLTPNLLQADIQRHLTFTLGKDVPNASIYDWRMALSFAIRDRIVEPWFTSTRRTWAEDRKRVYYLSMEFLIGRILEDATINLGLRDVAEQAMAGLAVWPLVSWNQWQRWGARPMAMASGMKMACSASGLKAANR